MPQKANRPYWVRVKGCGKSTASSHVKYLEEKAKKRARYIRPQTMIAA
ncbi:MAG: hypothetical protein HOK89_12340 [Rhodospirillaceae bacterium]|nr:hypothetical protein [Rhodospirillaceae bacterium]